MHLKKSFIIASVVILILVIVIIAFKLTFSGVILASWFFVLLFGVATTHFFKNGTLTGKKISQKSKDNSNFFTGLNLILLIVILGGFFLLMRNLFVNQSFNVIHVSVVLYGTGLLIGNNFKGFEY